MTDMHRTYEDGLRDGRLDKIEEKIVGHEVRMNHHSQRIRMLEMIAWAMFGIVALIEFVPRLESAISIIGGK